MRSILFFVAMALVEAFVLKHPEEHYGMPVTYKADTTYGYHRYHLTGSDTLFGWLISQIRTPGDVTPNQTNAVYNWILTAQPDTNSKYIIGVQPTGGRIYKNGN